MSKDKKLLAEEAQKKIDAENAARDMRANEEAAKGVLSVPQEESDDERNDDLKDSPTAKIPSLYIPKEKRPKRIMRSVTLLPSTIKKLDVIAKKNGTSGVAVIRTILDKFLNGELVEKENSQ